VELQLKQVKRMAHAQGVGLVIDNSVVDHLAAAGFRPEFGAREVRRLMIRSELETQLARAMLANEVHEGDRVLARWDSHEQKVVLAPQPMAEGEAQASGTAADHRNTVEVEREAQRGSGDESRTAAE
jgi:ATP-dependent Clp protease ATP-binding subunit ClpC